MLDKEPTAILGAIGELARQVVPMLLLFGIINWTDPQIAGVFMVVSGCIKVLEIVLTRSRVVPTEKANEQIQTGIDSPHNTTVEQVIAATEAKTE